ncbi:DUF4390 domain-containing protein [Vogesella facilis]|uniref:DUF4390 domain-containing protein n=1 Tax=Vogesella facilis TaxID=1655232 RepID=A0ABV7RE03_9NEIS
MTASITRCWRNVLSLLLVLAACLLPLAAQAAEGITALRARAEVEEHALAISTRYQIVLPNALQDAVQQGIPLTFRLTFELTHPRSSAYWLRFKHFFEPTASINFKLMYYRLTNRYRVAIGSLANNYNSLAEALAAVGSIAGWRVLDVSDWDESDRRLLRGRVQLELDIGQLPRPFQLNALGASDWSLESAWTSVTVEGGS